MGTRLSLLVVAAPLLCSAGVAGIALPLREFGDSLSNVAIFSGPQLAVIGLLHFLSPRQQPSFLAGVSLAMLAVFLLFALPLLTGSAANFMVVYIYWFAVASAAVTSLLLQRFLPKLPRVSAFSARTGVTAFIVTLAGSQAMTRLFLS